MRSKRISEPGARFIAAWEFQVKTNKQRAFERAYGPQGDWVRLFRQGEGYVRTEMFRDPEKPGRYVTLDFWTSRLAYLRFKGQHLAAYKALDKRCEKLTQSERRIGEFEKAVPVKLIWPTELPSAASNSGRIRHAMISDIPSIIAIERSAPSAAHWGESAYRDFFRADAPAGILLIGECTEGSLVAFIVARKTGEDCELENVVVEPRAQRTGVGSNLVGALKVEARKRSCARMFLEVRESNLAARKLYEKCGFRVTGRRNSYYQNPSEDALLYALEL